MPKELVYSANPETDVVEHVAVGWSRDRCVQLGVVEGPSVQIEINGEAPETKGLWLDLDRTMINNLIRSLRKARDSAYGPDA